MNNAPARHTVVLNIVPEKFTPSKSSLEVMSQESDLIWHETEVKSGESLSLIFSRMNASANELYRILQSSTKAESLKNIFSGHTLRFGFNDEGVLMALQYIPSRLEQLEFLRNDDGQYVVEHVFKQPDIQLVYRYAVIQDSLYLAGQDADISSGLIMRVTNIFSGRNGFCVRSAQG